MSPRRSKKEGLDIRGEAGYSTLTILINGMPNVVIDKTRLVGFYAYENPRGYHVEYVFDGNASMLTGYDTREKWFAILEILGRELR